MISSRLTARDSLLFVYGTLRPFVAIPMARWLRRAARYVGPATTRGRLYDLGSYPGMRAARNCRERVLGDVYRVVKPHVFRVLERNGRPVQGGEWGDTVLVDPDSRAEIAFVADNPGDWMFHCHVLEHQASGMMATIRVA